MALRRFACVCHLLTCARAAPDAAHESSAFRVRNAGNSDILAIMSTVHSAELVPAPSVCWWEERIADDLCFVVCDCHNAVVGVAATRAMGAEYGLPARTHVSVIAVSTHAQRRGVGSMLIQRACETDCGPCVSLYVRCTNKRAIDWYCRRHGFACHRRIGGYYKSPVEDALLLVRSVSQSCHHRSKLLSRNNLPPAVLLTAQAATWTAAVLLAWWYLSSWTQRVEHVAAKACNEARWREGIRSRRRHGRAHLRDSGAAAVVPG